MSYPVKIDLHMHTVLSDGTDKPEEMPARVKEAGLELFSVTDHDSVTASGILRGILRLEDPKFVSGAEFSCRDEQGKYHILGYGFDPDSESIRELVGKGHGLRMKKVRMRLDFLRDRFGFDFPPEEIEKLLGLANPGKPHIGNLMVRYGFAETKEAAIRDYIDKARIRSEYIRPEEAVSGILGGGGIPILAHPIYGSGDQLIMGEEMDDMELAWPGEVHSKKTGKVLSYYEIIHTSTSGTGRGHLIAPGSFTTAASSVPYGAHFAQVAVNIRTGEVKVQKFYAVQDAGTPINPEAALCQMYGASLKSIGHTLYEDMILDKDGRCVNATMTDYGVPMISEQPDDFKAVLIDVDDAHGPFGAKSISEIACNGAAPAIGNAIHDACGVWMRSWPMTPEKILRELGKIK